MNIKVFPFVIVIIFLLAFQSCNTEGLNNEAIIGSWRIETSNQGYKEYYSFDSNGITYKFRVYEENDAELVGPKGTYAISERSIQLVFEEEGFFYDYMFDGDTLFLENNNEKIMLIKVGELDLAYLPIF